MNKCIDMTDNYIIQNVYRIVCIIVEPVPVLLLSLFRMHTVQ